MGKYFKYAIGEILLVMIGILLALQVNTWNEQRKNRITEINLYKSLISSLENDLIDVKDKIAIVESSLKAQDIFMKNSFDYVQTKFDIPQIEKLLLDVRNCSRSFFPNYGLYNKISNNNQIDLIRSEALQMKIIELYEQFYKRYYDVDQNIEHQNIFSLEKKYFSNLRHLAFKEDGWNNLTMDIIQKDYTILQDEIRQINALTLMAHFTMQDCETQIENLLNNLQNTLNTSND